MKTKCLKVNCKDLYNILTEYTEKFEKSNDFDSEKTRLFEICREIKQICLDTECNDIVIMESPF